MATFILVHGTWAKAHHWPALRDGLAIVAGAAGELCRIEELRWSGKNRTSARQRAASDILSIVQEIHSASKDEKVFIIGHSHGGSAIAYFLKEHPALANTLGGCAFLSTPFIAIRPRVEATVQFLVPSFFLLYVFSASFPYLYLKLSGGDYLSNASLLYPSAFGLAVVFGWFVYLTVRKFGNAERLLEKAHQAQTAELPPGNYLFLRCSGDEAAAGLSAAQFIAWLSMKVSRVLQLIIRPAWPITWKSVAYFTLFGLITTWWTSFTSPADRDGAIRALGMPYWLVFSLWFAYLSLVACSAAALLIFLTQAITARAFGWTELTIGFFVELAIEPLPFGPYSLVHIDWSAYPLEGKTHSWTYAHPLAIQRLQDWVKTALHRDGNS